MRTRADTRGPVCFKSALIGIWTCSENSECSRSELHTEDQSSFLFLTSPLTSSFNNSPYLHQSHFCFSSFSLLYPEMETDWFCNSKVALWWTKKVNIIYDYKPLALFYLFQKSAHVDVTQKNPDNFQHIIYTPALVLHCCLISAFLHEVLNRWWNMLFSEDQCFFLFVCLWKSLLLSLEW